MQMAGESFASTAELHFSAGYAEQTKEEGNSPRSLRLGGEILSGTWPRRIRAVCRRIRDAELNRPMLSPFPRRVHEQAEALQSIRARGEGEDPAQGRAHL